MLFADALQSASQDGPQSDEEVEENEEDESRSKAAQLARPAPQPITTIHPVAQSLPPRLFVVYPSGRGHEVVSQSSLNAAGVRAAAFKDSIVDVQPLAGAQESGSKVHSYLRQVPLSSHALAPMPIGQIALAQRYDPQAAHFIPSLKRTSVVTTTASQAATGAAQSNGNTTQSSKLPFSFTKYMPKIVAYTPQTTQPTAALPVLVYTEFVELSRIEEQQGKAIEAAIVAAEQLEVAIEEGHTRAVPFPDTRPEDARIADAEVLQQVPTTHTHILYS